MTHRGPFQPLPFYDSVKSEGNAQRGFLSRQLSPAEHTQAEASGLAYRDLCFHTNRRASSSPSEGSSLATTARTRAEASAEPSCRGNRPRAPCLPCKARRRSTELCFIQPRLRGEAQTSSRHETPPSRPLPVIYVSKHRPKNTSQTSVCI